MQKGTSQFHHFSGIITHHSSSIPKQPKVEREMGWAWALVPLAILAEGTVNVSGATSAAWVGTYGAGWGSRLATPERKAMVASAAERPVGRSGMGTGRFGSMSTPAKDVESGDSASSAPAFRDRYPLGSFEKEKWGGYLSSYKKDPARLLLAIAEDSVARGESGSVPLDFGPLFRPKMLLLHDADDVVHAMQNKRREFSKSKLRKETAGLVLGEGLLLSEGDKHARNRKVLRPSFEGSSLAKFIGTMESCCQGVEKAISKAVDDDEASGGGGVAEVDMSELVQEATLLMVTQCLFTSRSAGDGKRLKKWIGDAFRYTSILQKSNFRGLRLLLGNLGVGKSHRSFKSALGEMDKYVLDLVSNRRIGIEKEGQRVDDMLDMLLRTRFEGGDGFTDREIRDELVVMLLAGHDTSALALMWAFNFLAEYPEYAEAVYQETLRVLGPPNDEGKWADFTVESVMQMPETDRILKEVMRLRPPVFEYTREVTKSHELPSGRYVKKGQTVVMSAYVQGHMQSHFDRPDEFDPSRWESNEADGSISTVKPPEGHYIPFGFGSRTCIGFRFAEWEMSIMLAYVCRSFTFERVGDPIDFKTHITINPVKPVKLRVRRRI